ncbi:hypothetical protein GCM10027277_55140 [Pseudoduganella ginsengisoli]|uniref:DUF4214 domain-containing protein n=1 Tax=Pseudoduganella ginsengisoli TaxID=1462440 RepID=A0A6L6Q6Q6_9BURK|nr:DUF4214 domain-containing protein [Pseudoduganella ginsengisoli]MTW04951.1 DUF4214 domain-containing protein [Pseudoduganella ginsengisoli]
MTVVASKINLGKFSGATFDQKTENSCVANAITQAIRLQTREYHKDVGELAREQLYYDTRVIENTVNSDAGVKFVKDALESAKVKGIADQAVALPYGGSGDPGSTMYIKPSDAVYANAATQKLTGYTDLGDHALWLNGDKASGILETDVQHKQQHLKQVIGEYLMQGKPVLLSSEIPWALSLLDGSLQDQNYLSFGQFQPGSYHAMVIVGKDDSLHGGSYIIENSWGAEWGDNGFGYLPYDQLATFSNAESGFTWDGGFSLNVMNGISGVDLEWTPQRVEMAQLYASLLDRAADRSGLEYWAGQMKAGQTAKQIANNMYNSGEAQAKYAGLSDAAYVDAIYVNTMNHAADSGGRAYWANLLANKTLTRGELAVTLMNNVENSTFGPGTPSLAEHDYLMNRTTVSANFAITYQIDNAPVGLAAQVVDQVSSNADSVQVVLTGIQTAMGWA